MKREQAFILWAAGASLVAIVPWLYVFWSPTFSRRASDWADFGTFVGGVLSPTLAFAALIGPLVTIGQQRSAAEAQKSVTDNESYFKHAVSSLERAFNLLSSGEPHQPVHDRLAWLSCARLLLSAKAATMKITDASAGLLKTLTAKDAKYGFGQLIDLARSAPVAVSKHGRPVVVVVAVEEFERLMALEHPAKSPNARTVKKERKK